MNKILLYILIGVIVTLLASNYFTFKSINNLKDINARQKATIEKNENVIADLLKQNLAIDSLSKELEINKYIIKENDKKIIINKKQMEKIENLRNVSLDSLIKLNQQDVRSK